MLNSIKKFFFKFLELDRFYFEAIEMNMDFFNRAKSLAQESHPYEFFGLIEGKIKNKKLNLRDINFVPQNSNKSTVSTIPLIFNNPESIGTIHSHPNGYNKPSSKDLKLFAKYSVNIIISEPYLGLKDIRIYDGKGKELSFTLNSQ